MMRVLLLLSSLLVHLTSAAVYEALAAGVIGFTSYAISKMEKITVEVSPGGCKWFGTAPICREMCPDGWNRLRRSSDGAVLAQDQLYEALGKPNPEEEQRGRNCLHLFGSKVFCCKITGDRTWSGYYISAITGALVWCQYKPDVFDRKPTYLGDFCGKLHCRGADDLEPIVYDIGTRRDWLTKPGTMKCDEVYRLDVFPMLKGSVEYGRITWNHNGTLKLVDQWYKMPINYSP